MDARAESYPTEPAETLIEKMLKDDDCDIEGVVDLLDRLTLIDASTDLGDLSYSAGCWSGFGGFCGIPPTFGKLRGTAQGSNSDIPRSSDR